MGAFESWGDATFRNCLVFYSVFPRRRKNISSPGSGVEIISVNNPLFLYILLMKTNWFLCYFVHESKFIRVRYSLKFQRFRHLRVLVVRAFSLKAGMSKVLFPVKLYKTTLLWLLDQLHVTVVIALIIQLLVG